MAAIYDVQTDSPTNIGANSITLNGTIPTLDTNNIDCVCAFFEYGQQSDLSDATRISTVGDAAILTAGSSYSYNLTGLTADTQYYYQAKARMIKFDDPNSVDYITTSPGSIGFLVSYAATGAGIKEKILKMGVNIIEDYIHATWNDSDILNFWNNFTTTLTGFSVGSKESDKGLLTSDDAVIEIDIDFTDINTLGVNYYVNYKQTMVTLYIDGVEYINELSTKQTFRKQIDVSALTGVATFVFEFTNTTSYPRWATFYSIEFID